MLDESMLYQSMEVKLKELKAVCDLLGCEAKVHEALKFHTTFQIGGITDLFIRVNSVQSLQMIFTFLMEHSIPFRIMGKGSNMLISDSPLQGVVVALENPFTEVHLVDETTVCASAGTPLSRLCYYAYENALTGLEFAWGIPGTVGGAIYMNAGAYNGEIKDVLKSSTHLCYDGRLETIFAEQLNFSYRHSFYTNQPYCIVSGDFQLQKGDKQVIRARMDDLMQRRYSKQPIEFPSAGSTFKRPAGSYASLLIDQCGLKGYRIGGAMVSEKHAGFVINYDHASCNDVLCLIDFVKTTVKEKTGFSLECEITII